MGRQGLRLDAAKEALEAFRRTGGGTLSQAAELQFAPPCMFWNKGVCQRPLLRPVAALL